MRFLKAIPSIQIIYLQLPDGGPDGQGYETTNNTSLEKLYSKEIDSIITMDGSTLYTMETLKDLIFALLEQKAPHGIRVLDYKKPIPEHGELEGEHADHIVSSRIVVDVIEQHQIKSKVLT